MNCRRKRMASRRWPRGGTEDELHAAVIHTAATAVATAHTTCLYLGTHPRMRGDSEGTVKSRRVHPVLMLYETEPVKPGEIGGAALDWVRHRAHSRPG
jgi:hypothetical protein